MSADDIKKAAANGKILSTDFLRGVGDTEWTVFADIKEFAVPSSSAIIKPTAVKPAVKKETPAPIINTAPVNTGITDPFANLIALEQQGQAIYREPAAAVVPAVAAAVEIKHTSSGVRSIMFAVAPFFILAVLGWILGCLNAVIPIRILSYAFAGGTGKGAGLIAGQMLRKAGIKNEVISLGYGGLIAVVLFYVFAASALWTYVNIMAVSLRSMQQEPVHQTAATDESGGEDSKEKKFFVMDDGTLVDSEIEPESPQWEGKDINQLSEYKKSEYVWAENKIRNVSPIASIFCILFSPAAVISLAFSGRLCIYWIIFGCILIGVTVHSTWLANLGYDPTRQDGF